MDVQAVLKSAMATVLKSADDYFVPVAVAAAFIFLGMSLRKSREEIKAKDY
jgi:hypothetical protein